MTDVDKIAKMLLGDSIEKQIAAAIVLGELRAKGSEVVSALSQTLDSDIPLLQRHVLNALTRAGAKKALPKIFPLLTSSDSEVRRAAAEAVASTGEEVVATIRSRMATASPDERRALDGILAELGGKDAFTTLLDGLASAVGEAANQAAIAVRSHVKGADAKSRRGYFSEIEKFLKPPKKGPRSPEAMAAAVKILGYLEDDKALPTLLEFASDKKAAPAVRQEAIIALRFSLGETKSAPKVVDALLDAATSDDRTLAHTALHTLGSLSLPASVAKRLDKLVAHPDVERARFVIEQLGRQKDADAAKILVDVLTKADKKRADIAAVALTENEHAVPLLAKSLLELADADRMWMIRNVLRPNAKKIGAAMRKSLLELAMKRFGGGERNWEALFDVVRDADADAAAEALRTLAQKLKKGQNTDKALAVYRMLAKSDRATDDDRFAAASLELAKSNRDTRPAARAGDEALKQLANLAGRGYDVTTALRKDRGVDLEQMFYVGFHFLEEGHPAGEELLSEVVKQGGRTKIAKMAKNKLALQG
ncbi:MAG: HEAT repeat domain-containing protein [Polyangiaceae bacterium]